MAAAAAGGVRTSRSPASTITGTSGSGPGPNGVPAGAGQLTQVLAIPFVVAQLPNGPVDPGASPATAAANAGLRASGGSSGCQGNGPSPQSVAISSSSSIAP